MKLIHGECRWYSTCHEPAVVLIKTPTLGKVQTCARCLGNLDTVSNGGVRQDIVKVKRGFALPRHRFVSVGPLDVQRQSG